MGESNKWTVMIKMKGPQGYLEDGRSWDPIKMTSTNGDVFSLVARVHKEVVHVWILFFGTSEEARNYSCRVSIENKFGYEFNYSGPVHTLDKTDGAIIKSGLLLLIGATAA